MGGEGEAGEVGTDLEGPKQEVCTEYRGGKIVTSVI